LENGFDVFTPIGENSGLDFVAVRGGKIVRVQVKSTNAIKDGKMVFGLRKTRVNTRAVFNNPYPDTVDYFALYCHENDYVGLVENKGLPIELKIRVVPPRNGQKKGIRMAEDFTIARVLSRV
jgi:hypothetical protein